MLSELTKLIKDLFSTIIGLILWFVQAVWYLTEQTLFLFLDATKDGFRYFQDSMRESIVTRIIFVSFLVIGMLSGKVLFDGLVLAILATALVNGLITSTSISTIFSKKPRQDP